MTTTAPAHATVAFLRISRFAGRSVGEQAALKGDLEARAREAIARLPEADRAVLDVDDGLALVLFGDPSRALDVVESLEARSVDPLHVGLNYGPLALTGKGPDGRVIGDGIAAAAAAARFATSERPLATHDFLRALASGDPSRAAGFSPAGDFTDTRVRMHSLYAADPAKVAARRRHMLRRTALGVAAALLLGVSVRFALQRFFPPEPALVSLAIKPRGEVFVDGVSRGRSPPLARLELEAGRHVLSVRHPGFAPYEVSLDLQPGERATVAHTFVAPRQESQKGRGFWRDLRRRFWGS
ncbi:MAG TPA: PEGA domain-containing protein [Usitatibacter sp.]|nr:PEGA domain-containing protein [Usitatibacter sp.]